MFRRTATLSLLLPALSLCGCQVLSHTSGRAQPAGPPLPMTLTCEDLVDHLNRQSGQLHSWQCTKMRMTVRMPRQLPLKFDGHIACQSPNRFHLTASNLIASADLGANDERCWVLMKPFEAGTISWRHEDAHLIQQLPSGVPYIDPDWLMLVLGVKRLDADDYQLSRGQGRELQLTASSRRSNTGIERYVIKVDANRRVVREHVAYDRHGRVVVRAILNRHQEFNGHVLPTSVRLEFPLTGAQMHLTFRDIQTNPVIDTAHWEVPSDPYAVDVDLGELLASRPDRRRQQSASQTTPVPKRTVALAHPAEPDWSSDSDLPEPDWDRSDTSSHVFSTGYRQSRRRQTSFWKRVLDPFNLTGRR